MTDDDFGLIEEDDDLGDLQPTGMLVCRRCELGPSPVLVECRGNPASPIVIVGEAPADTEIEEGAVFVGPSGFLLETALKWSGLSEYDPWTTNAVKCRLPGDVKRRAGLIESCSNACKTAFLRKEVWAYPRELIIALGGSAHYALGAPEIKGVLERTWHISDNLGWPAPVLYNIHPAAVLHSSGASADKSEFFFDVLVQGFRLAATYLATKTLETSTPPVEIASTAKRALFLLRMVEASSDPHGIDTETFPRDGRKATDWYTCGLLGVSFSLPTKPLSGAWIPAEILEDPRVKKLLAQVLADSSRVWYMHNAKFDKHVLGQHIGEVRGIVHDTQSLAQHRNENLFLGLKEQCSLHFSAPEWDAPTRPYMKDLRKADQYLVGEYAALDGAYTRKLGDEYAEERRNHAYQILNRASAELYRTESRGVLLDRVACGEAEDILSELQLQAKETLQAIVADHWCEFPGMKIPSPEAFNPNSRPQLADALYRLIGFPCPGTTATGQGSTDEASLASIAGYGPAFRGGEEFLRSVKVHVKSAKLLGTYIRGMEKRAHSDGCVRTSFNMTGTVSGRISSKEPNLQNVPEILRPIFRARDGMTFIDIDYAQLEVCIGASISSDPVMVQAVRDANTDALRYEQEVASGADLSTVAPPLDVHRMIASIIFERPPESITKDERREAKAVTFGLMYGKDLYTFTQDFEGDEAKAKRLWDAFFGKFVRFGEWMEEIEAQSTRHGWVSSPFGRIRHVPLALLAREPRMHMHHRVARLVAKAGRQAGNSPIQGTAGLITLHRMCDAADALRAQDLDCYPLVTVHDSVLFECATDDVVEAEAVIKEVMQTPFNIPGIDIPLRIDMKVGDHWCGKLDPDAILEFIGASRAIEEE